MTNRECFRLRAGVSYTVKGNVVKFCFVMSSTDGHSGSKRGVDFGYD